MSSSISSFSFSNINFVIKRKKILDDLHGNIRANKMTAILGCSGVGKTSFLKILSGRLSNKHTGMIKMNGITLTKDLLRQLTGYVHQNDILPEFLTVGEYINFSNKLRAQKNTYTEVTTLNLHNTLTYTIGNTNNGISGGERKRVSIALEILTDPEILFLDEPLSGLDIKNALNTTHLLKNMQKTIVATIHQPSSKILELFDDILILNEGKIIYHNTTKNFIPHFSELGFKFPNYTNPAEILFIEILPAIKENKIEINTANGEIEISQITEISNISDQPLENNTKERNTPQPPKIGKEIKMLLLRNLISTIRNKNILLSRLLQCIGIIFIIGTIFYDLPSLSPQDKIINTNGFLYFLVMYALFGSSMGCVHLFYNDINLLVREYSNNYYSISSYFISRVISDTILYSTFILISSISLFCISKLYNQIILQIINIWLLSMVGYSMGIFISSICLDLNFSLVILPSVLLPLTVVSGLFVNPYSLVKVLRWLQYISPSRYAYNIAMRLEYGGKLSGIENRVFNNFFGVTASYSFLVVIYVLLLSLSFISLYYKVRQRI